MKSRFFNRRLGEFRAILFMFTFFGPLQEQWSKVLWPANSQVPSMEEELGKLTLTLTKRKTVKFSILFTGHNFLQVFRLVSISAKSPAQRTCTERQKSTSKAGAQKSRFETGAPRYSSNDLFCLSFSPFFGKDTFALRSGFKKL